MERPPVANLFHTANTAPDTPHEPRYSASATLNKENYMNANLNSNPSTPFANPWVQLILGVICMACVANLQYGWTLFVNPIDAKYHWGRSAIQIAFTIFVLIETWLVPVEGYLVDRFGPKWLVLGGGILVAIAWVLNSFASSLPVLYFAA